MIARVGHCLRVLANIMKQLTQVGLKPVFARKHEDDSIDVVLWAQHNNPPVQELTVRGYAVKLFIIPWGQQCTDYDEALNEITEPKAFDVGAGKGAEA